MTPSWAGPPCSGWLNWQAPWDAWKKRPARHWIWVQGVWWMLAVNLMDTPKKHFVWERFSYNHLCWEAALKAVVSYLTVLDPQGDISHSFQLSESHPSPCCRHCPGVGFSGRFGHSKFPRCGEKRRLGLPCWQVGVSVQYISFCVAHPVYTI